MGCSIHACRAVDELLGNAGALTRLHFFNNMTGDEGAAAIAGILARAPMLRDFRLASSRVGPDGGAALARGLCGGIF